MPYKPLIHRIMSYTASYSYDRNANMRSFERHGITDVVSGYEYGVHNSVSMTYTDGGNRLSSIDVTREGADYERRTGLAPTDGLLGGFVYDANGNLICDPSRDIVLIRYNHLNLPVDIRFGNGQRQTIGYDGAGRKLSVEYSQTTHSVVLGALPDDDDYTVTSVRRYVGPHIFTDGVLEYSGFENGYFDPAQGVMYYAADWQGNNIGVYTAEGRRTRNITYYPYGEPTIEPVGERFLFGGKEREHGGGRNSYDFGARILSSGAWTTPDPLAEKFYPLSPYSYCGGDPINHIDRDGRWTIYLSNDKELNKRAYKIPKDARIHVVGHGNHDGILYDKEKDNVGNSTMIKSARGLIRAIRQNTYKSRNLLNKPVVEIVLHSCQTGEDPDANTPSFAQKISEGIPNAIITAPNGFDYIDLSGKETVIDSDGDKRDKEDSWRIFFRGKEIPADCIDLVRQLLEKEDEIKNKTRELIEQTGNF